MRTVELCHRGYAWKPPFSLFVILLALFFASCGGDSEVDDRPDTYLLPTNQFISPVGDEVEVGSMPMNIAVSPDGSHLIATASTALLQNLTLVDLTSMAQVSRIPPMAIHLTAEKIIPNILFDGLAYSTDGQLAYASGGCLDVIFPVDVTRGVLVERQPIKIHGCPNGLAISPDGKTLFAALETAETLAALDLEKRKITRESVHLGYKPWAVAVHPSGNWVYVTLRGAASVCQLDASSLDVINIAATEVHPASLAVTPDGGRLFVANANSDSVSVFDAGTLAPLARVDLTPFPGAKPGDAAGGIAISPDGARVYVTLGYDNAVAVIDTASLQVVGWIPTAWYPSSVAVSSDSRTIYVSNMKGPHLFPRTYQAQPLDTLVNRVAGGGYIVPGTVSIIPVPDEDLQARYTQWVEWNNGWNTGVRPGDSDAQGPVEGPCWPIPCKEGGPTPFKHVVLIVRENKTFDQIFGDMPGADADPSLVMFGRQITPNGHALAEQFILPDNYYMDNDHSSDGHIWVNAGIGTDYIQRTFSSSIFGLRRPDDSSDPPMLPIVYPETPFLFDNCFAHGVTFRNYGEFVKEKPDGTKVEHWADNTNMDYPSWDPGLKISEKVRYDVWKKDFDAGIFPAFSFVFLPRDHTNGLLPSKDTPRFMVAENDYYTGKVIEDISHSQYWPETLIFVIEDDAGFGADHVANHRSFFLAASPYVKRGLVCHERLDFVRLFRTIEVILGLPPTGRFDAMAIPMHSIFTDVPDFTPYTALPMNVPHEVNPAGGLLAELSSKMDFNAPDSVPDGLFSRVLWEGIRGTKWPPRNARFVGSGDEDDD